MQALLDFWNNLIVMLPQLVEKFGVTVSIFFLTLIFSLPLGLLLSFGRMAKNGPVRSLSKIYISIMRGTPLMLQLVIVYFAPYYIFKIKISNKTLWFPPCFSQDTKAKIC